MYRKFEWTQEIFDEWNKLADTCEFRAADSCYRLFGGITHHRQGECCIQSCPISGITWVAKKEEA